MMKGKTLTIIFASLVAVVLLAVIYILFVSPQLQIRAAELPTPPEFYADFVDEYNYSTLGFQYSKNEAIPVCFLMDVYNYVHQNYGHKLLTWRIISQSHNTVEYVFGFYDGSFLGRFSPKKRRLMKFITSYESPEVCDKRIEELNSLFPAISYAQ